MLVLQAVGVNGSGYCGFMTAISLFDSSVKGTFLGILALAIAGSFATCAAASFLLLTKVLESRFCHHKHFYFLFQAHSNYKMHYKMCDVIRFITY